MSLDKGLEKCFQIAHAIDTEKINIVIESLAECIVKACKQSSISESDKIQTQLLLSNYRIRLLKYMLGVGVPMAILSEALSEKRPLFPTSSRVTELPGGGKMKGGVNPKQVLASIFTAICFIGVGNSIQDRGLLDNNVVEFEKYLELKDVQENTGNKITFFSKDPSDAAREIIKSSIKSPVATPEIIYFTNNPEQKPKIDALRAALDEYNAQIDSNVDSDLRYFLKLELGEDNSLPVVLPLKQIGESLTAIKNAHEDWIKSPANMVTYIPSLETLATEWVPVVAATAIAAYGPEIKYDEIFPAIKGLGEAAASGASAAAPRILDAALKVGKIAAMNPQAAAGAAVLAAQLGVDLVHNYVVKPTAAAIKNVDDAYNNVVSDITGHQEKSINAVIKMQNELSQIDSMLAELSISTKSVFEGKQINSVRLFSSPNIEYITKWANWKSEGKVIIAAIKNFFSLSAYLATGAAEFGKEAIKIEFKLGSKHLFENAANLVSLFRYILSTSFYNNCLTGALIFALFRLYLSNKAGKSGNVESYEEDDRSPRRTTQRRQPVNSRNTRKTSSPPPERPNPPTRPRRVIQAPSQPARNMAPRPGDQQYSEEQRNLMREAMKKFPNLQDALKVIARIKRGDFSDFKNRSRSRSRSKSRSRTKSTSKSRDSPLEEGEELEETPR